MFGFGRSRNSNQASEETGKPSDITFDRKRNGVTTVTVRTGPNSFFSASGTNAEQVARTAGEMDRRSKMQPRQPAHSGR